MVHWGNEKLNLRSDPRFDGAGNVRQRFQSEKTNIPKGVVLGNK